MSPQAARESTSRLIVVGGRQRRAVLTEHAESHRYDKALIVEVEPSTSEVRTVVEYKSPPHLCPDDLPSFVFKAGTLVDQELLVCTTTEIMRYDINTWERTRHVTHPWLNDVHHVIPAAGDNLLVVNTGLDMVMNLNWDGELLKYWFVGDPQRLGKFDETTDFRKVPSMKPHDAHANFIFNFQSQYWVTRCNYQDALCVTDSSRRLLFETGRPHDGVEHEGRYYFTTVNGYVIEVASQDVDGMRVIDLNPATRTKSLGWCRGILPISRDRAWLGFSRLRRTAIKENLNWVRQSFNDEPVLSESTRVALYDFVKRQPIAEIVLEDLGLNAVFGIYRG